MSDPYTGQVTAFAFPFAPANWAFCDGRTAPINQYGALFSLIGALFGGDGISKFGLPDLRGSSPCGAGNGPGLTPRQMGAAFGAATVTVDSTTMPAHNHIANASAFRVGGDRIFVPQATAALTSASDGTPYTDGAADTVMSQMSVSPAGLGGSHNNMQPYIVLNYCIALLGQYPEFDN